MEILNDTERHHVPTDIVWSIGSWEENRIIEENRVGYADPDGDIWIEEIPDGEYPLVHWAYTFSATEGGGIKGSESARKWTSTTRVRVQDGLVDKGSVKTAVAEVLNQSGTWHVFVERLFLGEDGKTITAGLGS